MDTLALSTAAPQESAAPIKCEVSTMICEQQQDAFTVQLPSMTRLIRAHFKHLSPDRQEKAIQNAVALTWKFYRNLAIKGREQEPGILKSVAWYAIRQTKSGRMIQGSPRAKDANEHRRRGRIRFEEFDLEDYVGRSTPVVDQVSFRLDVPRFMDTLNERQRQLAFDLATGMTTKDVAAKYGVTAGAISQFRARFKKLFDDFFVV